MTQIENEASRIGWIMITIAIKITQRDQRETENNNKHQTLISIHYLFFSVATPKPCPLSSKKSENQYWDKVHESQRGAND